MLPQITHVRAKIGVKRKDTSEELFTILIADDDPHTRQLLSVNFKRRNFAVYEVEDGRQAVEFLAYRTPDLIILDLSMPVMNGAEVCGWIRQRGIEAPILVLTSHSAPALQTSILNAGANDYVTKPFVIEEFLARVRTLLLRSVTQPATFDKSHKGSEKPE